jgi:hypothetical protein
MIVCIPTKGRPKTKTWKLFAQAGYEVFHFVEPQEFAAYDVPNKVDIGINNRGVTFVRNFMLDWAAERSEWAWFCDDDVSDFGVYKDGKTLRSGVVVLSGIERKAAQLPFEIVGLNYVQHAWHEKTAYSVNKKFAEVCVLMNVKKITWRYEENTKEDRDFAMQTIQNGAGVLRFNHVWFACPDVGTNAGGLHDWYASKKDEAAARKMVLKWDPWVTLKQKGNRLDMKCDLAGFAKHCGKDVK